MSSIQEGNDGRNQSPPQVEKQSNTGSDSHPDLPSKLLDAQHPFKFAPPKPEGDLWASLLEPLVQNDRVQCDAWKDEVQNLLIFAGLFSAVVTAFIVESYKNLQADPNDTIVSLLSQIALQMDRSLNATTVKLEPANSFVPTSSSIRVNVFWFISLVLSLATVVIGIVSLQWLREHQSYESDLSSREKYALYNMRADGLRKWHVDKIFTSLPLLLQSALVLFLGGVIDFLHAIGYWAVTIPVVVAISFILLFLIATTLLPCLQVLSLYVYFPRRNGTIRKHVAPPSQCPYKSPQSHAVRRIFISIAQLYDRVIMLHIPRLLHRVMHYLRKPFTEGSAPFQPGYYSFHPFEVYLGHATHSHLWGYFDLAWLNIRDAYMRRSFGQQLDYGCMLGREDCQIFPTYDIVMGLLSQNDEKLTAIPAYHCFDEVSMMRDDHCWYRQDVYLYHLVANGFKFEDDICLADFLSMVDSPYPRQKAYSNLLRQQNLFAFVGDHNDCRRIDLFRSHSFELNLQLTRHYPQEDNGLRNSKLGEHKIPNCFKIQSRSYFLPFRSSDDLELSSQFGEVALLMLRWLESCGTKGTILSASFIQQHQLADFISLLGILGRKRTIILDEMQEDVCQPANERDAFALIPSFLAEHLTGKALAMMSASAASDEHHSSLLFYLAVLYCESVRQVADPRQCKPLLAAVCKYKELTIDKGLSDPTIEAALCAGDVMLWADFRAEPFSKGWWDHVMGQIRQASTELDAER